MCQRVPCKLELIRKRVPQKPPPPLFYGAEAVLLRGVAVPTPECGVHPGHLPQETCPEGLTGRKQVGVEPGRREGWHWIFEGELGGGSMGLGGALVILHGTSGLPKA